MSATVTLHGGPCDGQEAPAYGTPQIVMAEMPELLPFNPVEGLQPLPVKEHIYARRRGCYVFVATRER